MTYLHAAPDAPYDEDELPCVPSMDMLQDYYNTGSRFADKNADEEEQDDDGPAWD